MMGCCFSGNNGQEDGEPLAKPKYSWEREDRIDRSVLFVSKQEGTVVTRLPGQLKGNQFIVQECTQCTILVLDYTATVTIDKCTDCQILIAPCRGSVFLRDCTNCSCVVACQQFRARDCKKCSVSLLSTTNPVIEASSRMTFSCFQCSYPQLKDLFDSAQLSVFNNTWSTIHDFDGSSGGGNWTLNHEDNPAITDLPTEGEVADIGISFDRSNSVVPFTVGPKQRPSDEGCLVAFFNVDETDAPAVSFVSKLQGKVTLVLTKRVKMQSHEAERIFPDEPELASKAMNGHAIFLEVAGDNCCQLCRQTLDDDGEQTAGTDVYISPSPERGETDVEAFSNYVEANVGM